MWRDSDATRKREVLAAEVARCREEMLGLESSKDKMARRILQKILLGVVSRCFAGWVKLLREAKQEARLGALRAEAEEVETRLTWNPKPKPNPNSHPNPYPYPYPNPNPNPNPNLPHQ